MKPSYAQATNQELEHHKKIFPSLSSYIYSIRIFLKFYVLNMLSICLLLSVLITITPAEGPVGSHRTTAVCLACLFSSGHVALSRAPCSTQRTFWNSDLIMAPPWVDFWIQRNLVLNSDFSTKVDWTSHSTSLSLSIFILKWKVMLFKWTLL